MKKPGDILRDHAAIYDERNAIYGASYLNIGPIFAVMFPNGLLLKDADDFNRFHLLMLEQVKVTRYSAQFENGGHADSADDGSVYWAMLREVDGRIAQRGEEARLAEAERQRALSTEGLAAQLMGDDTEEVMDAPPATPEPAERRNAFIVPEGFEAVRDADGKATGEVVAISPYDGPMAPVLTTEEIQKEIEAQRNARFAEENIIKASAKRR